MTSASATCTPTSLQLRLALSSRVRRKPHSVYLLPSRFASKPGLVIVCVSQRTGSDSSKPPADGLAGWDDSGNDVKSSRAKKKSFIQGVVGVGVAGIVLVAGLSYAVASFNKRSNPNGNSILSAGVKQESVLLSSHDTPSDEGKVANSEETNLKEDKSLESDGIDQQGDEASGEDKILGTEDSSFDGTDATENISSQSDPETPESEKIIYESRSLVDSSSEVIDSQSSNLAGADNPTSEDPDSLPNTEATNVSDLEIQANGQKIDTVAVVVSVFSQSDSTSDPHTVPLDDMGTAFPTVTEDLSENVTELAFDDITPGDPDFPSIQGLAEAGLITSKLSNRDLLKDVEGPFLFSPDSLLSRQDLIRWKMALEKRQLPEADKKMLYKLSGFIDIDKINLDAWPAIIADLSSGEQGIASLAFGFTRFFQPHKPVTKAQAAIALSNGEASDIVSEELVRIEAESAAEKAVSAHNALVAEVEKDINASFEKELYIEREKIEVIERMAEQVKVELDQLREKREEENLALVKERAAVESEMEVLSRLRREAEEKLEALMRNKAEISFEKEKEEGKRAREQARALEEARKRWETNGLRVIVDKDLQEDVEQSVLLNTVEPSSVYSTEERPQTLIGKLKEMAYTVGGKSREVIFIVMEKIRLWIMVLKEYVESLGKRVGEMREAAIVSAKGAVKEVEKGTAQVGDKVKRMAEECRDGVGKISQRFKT
ncbi:hypothetical protein DY000_02011395 [Brassica cretica]|uniref:SLH domain-containing protein n=1 Tax=Brassica cretica TaxID=69181 RepID=A0ABQ7D581_BRACR|nr:hypothetical protein DY000_02011395 [Brassica cretica]